MTITDALIRLYPKSFRDRWGDDLRLEADTAGVQGLPDLAAGVVNQWLHPALWPATRTGQRYSRAAATLTAITMATWLLAYLTIEQDDTRVPDLAGYLMVFALALVSPKPRRFAAALIACVRRGIGRLAVPLALGAIVVVIANTGSAATPDRQLLMVVWWAALLIAAIQAPRVVTDLGDDAVQPAGPTRLRAAIYLLTAANAAIAIALLARTAATHHLLPAATAALIAGLTIPLAITRQDLSSL